MNVGVARERKEDETRVALTPAGARSLAAGGHQVLVEHDAGACAAFPDSSYAQVGARVVGRDELFRLSDMIIKVKAPLDEEIPLFRPGQLLFTYLHMDENAPPEYSRSLAATGCDAIAYEWVRAGGRYVLLTPMSELTGAVFARRAMEILMERKGVLGGAYLPAARPSRVLLIGGGTIAMNALNVFLRNCLEVVAFDKHPETFRERSLRYVPKRVLEEAGDRLQVVLSSEDQWEETQERIAACLFETDILFSAAVRRPTLPKSVCDYLVTREMLEQMPANGVVIESTACDRDLVETAVSSPKTRYVYQDAGQWHFNCDHVPAVVPVTATHLLTSATLPYIRELADQGFEAAVEASLPLAEAVMCTRGRLTHRYTCDKKGLEHTTLADALRLERLGTTP
ncbi:MAG: hypothetical protein FJ109_11175 [Deltaproteobacteria bacterium]|nr:hypothetical protein [Deltaproteobacteria bacterium]